MGQTACPVVSGTPRVVYSAFIKEQDWFAKNGLEYIDDTVTFTNLELLAKQLWQTWGDKLKITEDESNFALTQALKAQNSYEKMVQQKGKEILNLGFKVITINSIPKEVQFLEPFFKDLFLIFEMYGRKTFQLTLPKRSGLLNLPLGLKILLL